MSKKGHKRLSAFEIPSLKNPCKTLLANIRFASVDERVKTIVVTSSTPDEGKTTVCSNLACAMATAGHQVLLVDTDMRRRCLANMLDLHPAHGLYGVLSGECQLRDAIVPTSYDNLFFMDSEPNIPAPPDLLSTRRFAALVDKLRESYDYVIFDTPPLGAFVDAAIVSNLVDGTVLVVRQHKVKRDAVANAVQQLKAANARILGAVMTFTNDSDNDYYYAYYNERGERVKKGEGAESSSPAPSMTDEDLSTWARRTGVETTGRATSRAEAGRETRDGRNAAGSGTSAAYDTRGAGESTGFGAAASTTASGYAGRSERRTGRNNPRANYGGNNGGYVEVGSQGEGNPYTPGAFKPITPDARQPRHKSRRI